MLVIKKWCHFVIRNKENGVIFLVIMSLLSRSGPEMIGNWSVYILGYFWGKESISLFPFALPLCFITAFPCFPSSFWLVSLYGEAMPFFFYVFFCLFIFDFFPYFLFIFFVDKFILLLLSLFYCR